jgi:hypothetical protein
MLFDPTRKAGQTASDHCGIVLGTTRRATLLALSLFVGFAPVACEHEPGHESGELGITSDSVVLPLEAGGRLTALLPRSSEVAFAYESNGTIGIQPGEGYRNWSAVQFDVNAGTATLMTTPTVTNIRIEPFNDEWLSAGTPTVPSDPESLGLMTERWGGRVLVRWLENGEERGSVADGTLTAAYIFDPANVTGSQIPEGALAGSYNPNFSGCIDPDVEEPSLDIVCLTLAVTMLSPFPHAEPEGWGEEDEDEEDEDGNEFKITVRGQITSGNLFGDPNGDPDDEWLVYPVAAASTELEVEVQSGLALLALERLPEVKKEFPPVFYAVEVPDPGQPEEWKYCFAVAVDEGSRGVEEVHFFFGEDTDSAMNYRPAPYAPGHGVYMREINPEDMGLLVGQLVPELAWRWTLYYEDAEGNLQGVDHAESSTLMGAFFDPDNIGDGQGSKSVCR